MRDLTDVKETSQGGPLVAAAAALTTEIPSPSVGSLCGTYMGLVEPALALRSELEE